MSTESKQTPREQAEDITNGNREPHHIGEHTPETITQELFSLYNTKRMFRNKKWDVKHSAIRKIFESKFSIKEQAEIEAKVKKMLQGQG